ncbi:MAG TPA: hypothetical protein VF185_03920 [Patescibacteria group bacterium]
MQQTLVIIFLVVISIIGFLITKASVDKLKMGIFSYYPFNLFIPKSTKWTVVYFVMSIGALFLLLFFLSGVTSLRPA